MHATMGDIEAILDLCQEAHDQSPTYQHLTANRDRARDHLKQMILNPMFFVGYNGEGVVIGMASPAWWHDGLMIADLFCYARKGGLPLIKGFIRWAKGFPGDNEIIIGTTFGADDRADRLYQRLGFKRIGAQYTIEVTT